MRPEEGAGGRQLAAEPGVWASSGASRGSTGAQTGESRVGGPRVAGTPERAAEGHLWPQLRIGSLFSGTGALDLATTDVYGGTVVWHSQYEPPDKRGKPDVNQYAAKILAHHWPTTPNLGDITAINWQAVLAEHGPVDIVTGGFPCTDVSSAGLRAGLTPDTRSGLWNHMANAIAVLQPRLVVIENVQGLLSAPAAGDLEPCPYCMGDGSDGPALRALGAVLGDLASLGFDAEWCCIKASEVGAPHNRCRVIINAWPAAVDASGIGRRDGQGFVGGLGAAERGEETSTDTADLGHDRTGLARVGGHGPADGSDPAAHASRLGRGEGRPEPAGQPGGLDAAERSASPAPDADRGGLTGHGELSAGRDPIRHRVRPDADRRGPAAPDPQGAGQQRARLRGRPAVASEPAASDADDFRRRADVLDLRPGEPDVDWGDYGPAIRRWEPIIGRPAPWPTDTLGRLSPVFTEWLMGYPDGWVTCVPGLPRSAMLRALGNGVVRLQGAVALLHLHGRLPGYAQLPLGLDLAALTAA